MLPVLCNEKGCSLIAHLPQPTTYSLSTSLSSPLPLFVIHPALQLAAIFSSTKREPSRGDTNPARCRGQRELCGRERGSGARASRGVVDRRHQQTGERRLMLSFSVGCSLFSLTVYPQGGGCFRFYHVVTVFLLSLAISPHVSATSGMFQGRPSSLAIGYIFRSLWLFFPSSGCFCSWSACGGSFGAKNTTPRHYYL